MPVYRTVYNYSPTTQKCRTSFDDITVNRVKLCLQGLVVSHLLLLQGHCKNKFYCLKRMMLYLGEISHC